MQPTADGNSINCLEGIVREWDSFERKFFSRAYFLGETQLDPVVMSLIHLDESLEVKNLPDGRSILFDRASIRRRVMKAGRDVKTRFQTMKKRKDFDPLLFMLENKLPLDKACGTFPLVFDDYRLVSHSLRMAWAFFLTMRMKKLDRIKFNQRFKDKTFHPKVKNHLVAVFTHIYSQMRRFHYSSEKDLIKCLKNSLCYHVSDSLDQEEKPEGDHFNMVPFEFRPHFDHMGKEEKVNFFFSLLQSKSLCKEVPEDFILDTLIKHRDQLSSSGPPMSSKTLEDLRTRGKEFGKIVRKFYQPNRGFYPTNKASFAFPRNMGGLKGDLVHSDRLKNQTFSSDPMDRMEPLVIGLFGQPGMGKSSRLPELISRLSILFPGVKRRDLVYARSCNTDHWDGYCNQPIVVLDDLGQSLEGKDIKEFQTLVSCNPYVLPMADLEEKGTLFCSPIIIATSNLQYGQALSYVFEKTAGILDDASFWRRFHIPLYIEDRKVYQLKEEPIWIRHENLLMRPGLSRNISQCRTFDFSRLYYQRKTHFTQVSESSLKQDIWIEAKDNLFGLIPDLFREREKFHDNIRQTWTQVIDSSVETPESLISEEYFEQEIAPHLPKSLGFDMSPQNRSNTYALEFESFPPEEPLPVRVEPIVEPLKVRTITAGVADTFCLKAFQRAMWLALGQDKQFCLTHGTNNLIPAVQRIFDLSDPEDVWISGDYSAATDSIPIEASKALLEGILESIDHEPTKRWAMKEISPHLLVYPKSSGIKPVLQESGQLMGSLLSFPLLCLLNDCTARSVGLSPSKYLINGDDILMRAKRSVYPRWKEKVREFGLSLSMGKNYVHPVFGTVNSQLIMGGTVLDSGKQKVLDRRTQVLGECLRDLEVMMTKTGAKEVHALFKTVNRSKLSRTVRSIDVPVSHGGLALNWGERSNLSKRSKRTEILVYLHDLFKKIEPDKDCLSIPYLSKTQFVQKSLEEQDKVFNEPVPGSEHHEDFVGIPALKLIQNRTMSNSHLRNLFLGQDLEDLPSLSFLSTLQVPFTDKKVRKKIQSEIDRTFFQNFLDSNKEYDYETFKQVFLEAVRGTESATAVATKFLVPVVELDVRPDYLLKVVQGYASRSFDKDFFEKSLGKALNPKEFDLPPLRESPNFSSEVIESFDFLMEELEGYNLPWEIISKDYGPFLGRL
nr:MAG: putative RNA-dependent RNA polymerase [Narnaviridae sp.]